MAKNINSLQLLRNSQIFQNKEAAINGITGTTTQDGVIKLARYTEGNKTKTIFGIYNDGTIGTAGYTIYDSYQEVIASIQDRIASLESGSTEAIEEINKKLGSGVTSANTVTDQLEALRGNSSTAQSGDTSVAGAKKYTDGKVAQVVDDLDYTDTAVTGSYVSKVDETNGVITVTREALPSLPEVYEAGKPIIAVSEDKGQVAASAGTINAEFVNVADSGNLFTGSTVEAVLAEINAAYKAADTAIVGDATASGNTLGKLEDRIEALDANAKEYSIKPITTGLSTNVKEAWGLFDTDGNQSGSTINIYKDSAYKEIYLGTSADTINATTGEITKQGGDKQSLNYAYYKADGTYDLVKVDVSAFLSENEFQSGVTVTNHIVHGVVDSTSEKNSGNTASFLTVGANGFKVDGIKQEIINRINELDATVTGGSTEGTATRGHIQVVVGEADGKLTGVTVTETNIADADDLAALSAKTVTKIESSNSSISVRPNSADDGTISYDLTTDASKVKMTGWTADASGFTGITTASTVTEAVKAIETEFLANEATVSAALNDLEATKVENITVNGVTGTFNNKVASVTIDGNDVVLGADYAKPAQGSAIATGDTVDQALGKLEAKVDAAVAGGVTSIVAGNGIAVDATQTTTPTVSAKLTATSDLPSGIAENAIKFDATSAPGMYIEYIDCGTY